VAADHPYLAFPQRSVLRIAAAGFLSEGVTLGQQVGYFGWGGSDGLRDQANGLAGLDGLISRGAAHVTSLDDHFRRDQAPPPASLVTFWSDATEAALLAGFTALRVVTDTTPWAEGSKQRPVFLRGEHLVDRYRLDHPFNQLCAGDSTILDDDALAETVCIHPSSEGFSSPFHLRAAIDADFALDGEIDALTAGLLERVVGWVREGEASPQLIIDARGLAFVEHRSLLALERYAERTGVAAVLVRDASRTAQRLVGLLGLRRVRVETPR
jgi:anti-anti-sigma regulatory factor